MHCLRVLRSGQICGATCSISRRSRGERLFHARRKYPLYDVGVRITDVGRGKPFDAQSAMQSYMLGNLSPGMALSTNIRLAHRGKDLAFNIFFSARNGMWVQFLRVPWEEKDHSPSMICLFVSLEPLNYKRV